MAAPFVRRRVRTTQPLPGEAVFIDWDNPITTGMTVCLMHADQAYGFATAQDASGFPTVTGNVPYTAGAQANTPQGTGGRPTGTARMYSLSSKGAITSPNYSLFALGTCTSLATTQSAIDMDNSGPRYFQFRVDAGKVDFIPFNTSAATTGRATSTVAMTLAEMSRGFTIGATASPTRTAAFQNGALVVGGAVANLLTPGVDMPICIGARATGSQAWSTGALILVVIWTRTLSDMEMMLLSDNPWQLFKPRSRRVPAFTPSVETSAAWLDAITTTDLTSATYFSAAQVADILSAADSQAGAASSSAGSADTLTAIDTATSTLAALAAASDSLIASEALAGLLQAVAGLSDVLTVSDSSSNSASAAATYLDSLGLVEQITAAGSASATRADSVVVTDATNSLLTAIASASDSLAATEALAAFLAGEVPPVTIDAGSVTKAHWVTFAGGTRVVSFAGGTKVVVFGGGTRVVSFGGSGVKKVVFDGGTKRVAFNGGTKRVAFNGGTKRVVFGGGTKTVVF